MPSFLNLLHVEDSETDYTVISRSLKRNGMNFLSSRVENAGALENALQRKTWDIALCDYNLPGLKGLDTIAKIKNSFPDIPLIVVTGTLEESKAAELIEAGADDYVMKTNLPRLYPVVNRELKFADTKREQLKLKQEYNFVKISEKSALQTCQIKSEFLTKIKNETRYSMDSVLSVADLLLRTPLNEEQHNYLKFMIGSIVELLEIINSNYDEDLSYDYHLDELNHTQTEFQKRTNEKCTLKLNSILNEIHPDFMNFIKII
jgi:CheY-like chemotaxis protein